MEKLKLDTAAGHDEIRTVAQKENISPVLAGILVNRGLNGDEIHSFLYSPEDYFHDPFLFENMELVTERIVKANSEKEKVGVFADYDCDGITSAAILHGLFSEIGLDFEIYQPDRFTEGYGTNPAAVQRMIDSGVTLIITVDCGIKSSDDVLLAKRQGVDFIILDHHECGTVPDTPYIIDAKREGETYPFRELCGAGIAFKLAEALTGHENALRYVDIAAVGTIGDCVSLLDENRAIAAKGIEKLRRETSPGIRAIARAAGIDLSTITSKQIGFSIAPRINAAGRMLHPKHGLECLLSPEESADEKAQLLEKLNNDRRSETNRACSEAVSIVENSMRLSSHHALVLKGENWNKGVVGLVASQLSERFSRPAIVFAKTDTELIGSARSFGNIDLFSAISSQAGLLDKFGGHRLAAGLTMQEENYGEFCRGIENFLAEETVPSDYLSEPYFDVEVPEEELTLRLAKEFELLEPTGQDNESPSLKICSVGFESVQELRGGHLKCTGSTGETEYLKFSPQEPMDTESSYNLIGQLSVNRFRGKETPQFIINSISESGDTDIETYIERNAKPYARSFIAEIRGLAKVLRSPNAYPVICAEEDFWNEVGQKLSMTLRGNAFLTNTAFGAKKWGNCIKKYPGCVCMKTEVVKNTDRNQLLLMEHSKRSLFHYADVYLYGDFARADVDEEMHICLSNELLTEYKKTAEKYNADQRERELFLEAAESLMGGGGVTVDGMGFLIDKLETASGISWEKAWFLFNVFYQLGLIEIRKGDRIHVNYKKRDYSYEDNPLVQDLSQILNGVVQ